MKTFAVMSGNKVTNVIIANSIEDAELVTNSVCIEYTEENPAGIDWIYDEQNGKFIQDIGEENGTLG